MLIGLLAGLIQIGLGLVGVGRLIKYIPTRWCAAILSGVGLTIIGGQLPRVLGCPRDGFLAGADDTRRGTGRASGRHRGGRHDGPGAPA